MTLPPRRSKATSGIRRAQPRIWERHRRFVKSFVCCVPGCLGSPVDFAHVRSAANAGTGLKPHDWYGVSLCREHHREQHDDGAETFSKKHRIDLWALAAEFARKSPDAKMQAAMKGELA